MQKTVLAVVMLLNGCVVADMDSSNYDYVPWIQLFQKRDASGQTNVVQRKADLYACGVNPRTDLDDPYWSLNGSYPGETSAQFNVRRDHILSCMKEKGYHVYGFSECGPRKAPTGLCPN
ncbi:hypothetical protein V6A89_004341 [Enterobacter hormaechei]